MFLLVYVFYKEILKGKDVSIPNIKSWELIKEKNKNNSDLIALSEADKKITYGEMFDNFEKNAKVGDMEIGFSLDADELIINIYDIATKVFIIINVIYYMFIAKKKEKVFLYEKITNTKNVSMIEKENLEENKEEKTQQEDELCYKEKKKE